MRTWQPHTTRFSALVFSPDGKLLATTAGQSKLVWLWDATNGALVRKLHGMEFPARAVAFSPDGTHVAAMQAGPNIYIWDVETGTCANILAVNDGRAPDRVGFSPSGRFVYSDLGVLIVSAAGPGLPSLTFANPVGYAAVND